MHKDEVELFLKRAKNFLDGAKERFQKEDWDLTCFMAEQSVQLITKAFILEKGGELPKTHSIRKLFALLYQLTEKNVFKYDRKALLFLESAYLNSRYFSFMYEKEDAEEALIIAEDIKKVVKNVRINE
ncbi:MAG: HEPN domain-containing protein [Candidatus Lokiarchaeota archaeon]|nr:HEPN domain-containing protein [Candidatus Lokiarchaeota archaeon]